MPVIIIGVAYTECVLTCWVCTSIYHKHHELHIQPTCSDNALEQLKLTQGEFHIIHCLTLGIIRTVQMASTGITKPPSQYKARVSALLIKFLPELSIQGQL
jgi:hypothetical protein